MLKTVLVRREMTSLPQAEMIVIGDNTAFVHFQKLPCQCMPELTAALAQIGADATIELNENRILVRGSGTKLLLALNQLFRPTNNLTVQVAYTPPTQPPNIENTKLVLSFPYEPSLDMLSRLAAGIGRELGMTYNIRVSKASAGFPPTITLSGIAAWRARNNEPAFRAVLRKLEVAI